MSHTSMPEMLALSQGLAAYAAIVNDGGCESGERYRTDDDSPCENRMCGLKFHDWGMVKVLISPVLSP